MYKLESLKTIFKAIDDKLGNDIVVLDISEVSSLTSYFVIASGTNVKQIEAICDNVEFELKQSGEELKIMKEGVGTNWALIDIGYCFIHIFHEDNRNEFNLERIWADAKIIDNSLLK